MKDVVVRIAGIEMVNIKNVSYGKIELQGNQSAVDSEMKADILGIYGQNGSGKTAVIEILEFLKKLMSGNSLPIEIQDYITKGSNEDECKFSCSIKHKKETFNCDYSFKIKHFEKSTYITKEKLSYKKGTGEAKKINLEYRVENNEYLFTPQYRFNEFIQNDQARRSEMIS
ncbi:AAA family ATPase [Acetobacterium carbinolicum]|uniref:AAA family ATPase n=1 Tax=Acetobacterium carbinolicum TaxID=52690 RepID=UPI003BF511CA